MAPALAATGSAEPPPDPPAISAPAAMASASRTSIGTTYPVGMAETLPLEGISARLAEIRGQLKLLADYL